MRKPHNQSWEVEIAPRAWEQLGIVPGDVFRAIQKELDAVARKLTAGSKDTEGFEEPVTTSHGPYSAQYVLMKDAQLVVLQRVFRSPVQADADDLTSTGKRKRKV